MYSISCASLKSPKNRQKEEGPAVALNCDGSFLPPDSYKVANSSEIEESVCQQRIKMLGVVAGKSQLKNYCTNYKSFQLGHALLSQQLTISKGTPPVPYSRLTIRMENY